MKADENHLAVYRREVNTLSWPVKKNKKRDKERAANTLSWPVKKIKKRERKKGRPTR